MPFKELKPDLDFKFISEEEKFWQDLLERFIQEKKSIENQKKLNDAVIEMCKSKLNNLKGAGKSPR